MTAPLVMRLRTPGDLVAAVPVVMGFHPVDSLVLMALGGRSGRRIGLTIRLDLPPPDVVGAVAGVAEAAVEALFSDTPEEAAVIVVRATDAGPPDGELVDRVATELAVRGVSASTMLWAAATTSGAPWHCYGECGCAGTVPDQGSSVAMATGVVAGRVVAARREDLAARLAPRDPAALQRRDRLLTDRDSVSDLHARLARLDEAVHASQEGCLTLDDERVVDLAVTLGLPEGREAAARHSIGATEAAAAQLWAALARETPDPEAAEPRPWSRSARSCRATVLRPTWRSTGRRRPGPATGSPACCGTPTTGGCARRCCGSASRRCSRTSASMRAPRAPLRTDRAPA